jgi:hypothetical protein
MSEQLDKATLVYCADLADRHADSLMKWAFSRPWQNGRDQYRRGHAIGVRRFAAALRALPTPAAKPEGE